MEISCGRGLTFSIHPFSGHLTPPRRFASSSRGSFPAPEDSNEDHRDQTAVLHDTPADSSEGGNTRRINSSNAGLGSQEKFDEEVMIYYHSNESSLISEFLNLNDETRPCADWMVTDGIDSLATFSSSLPGTVTDGETREWELKPTSIHHFDMKKFEIVTDFAGEEATPWPWGDYKYRPPTPQRYPDPEEYIMECQLAETMEEFRDDFMEAMAQEAIFDGEMEVRRQRRERREGGRVEREDDRPITIAFNGHVIRGRTIYNP